MLVITCLCPPSNPTLMHTLHRLQLDYGDADEKYASLDPDKDTLALKPTSAAAGAGGKGAPPKRKNLDEAGL